MPPKAILRHIKFKSQKQAELATAHNHRTDEVANADREAPHPNVEYINTEQRGYWELAEERIAEAGITIRRKDAIRCAELILTASPEFFKRDENGRAKDYSTSQWLEDTKKFVLDKFGKDNVIAFQLQQDEKTPHVHAVIVPITPDGRLSARDVLSPTTLRENQTEYAQAMTVHGLERGIERSQAKHQPMKTMYGQQNHTAAELGEQMGRPSSYQDVEVKRPSVREALNMAAWEAKTTATVNEQARAQVEAANQRAEKSVNLALENAAASERVRVLQKQLETLEGLKRADYKALEEQLQVAERGRQANLEGMTQAQGEVKEVAMRLAGGEAMPERVQEGNRLLDELGEKVKAGREKVVEFNKQADEADRKGDYGLVAELRCGKIPEQEKENKPLEDNLSRFAGGKARLGALDEEQAMQKAEQDKLAKDAADEAQRKADKEAADKKAADDKARADRKAEDDRKAQLVLEQAAEKFEQEFQHAMNEQKIRNRERSQIQLVSAQIIPENTSVEGFFTKLTSDAAERGIVVEKLEKGQYILSVKGSKHKFEHHELFVNGQSWADAVNTKTAANKKEMDDFTRQREIDNDQQITM